MMLASTTTLAKPQEDLIRERTAEKLVENLYNYVMSFGTQTDPATGMAYLPVKVFQVLQSNTEISYIDCQHAAEEFYLILRRILGLVYGNSTQTQVGRVILEVKHRKEIFYNCKELNFFR